MSLPFGVLFAEPYDKPLSSNGQFMANCYRIFYASGTTTLAPVYQDGNLTTLYSQTPTPITADGSGRFNPIYLDPTLAYRVQLFNSSNQLLQDVDPYSLNTTQFKNFGYNATFGSGFIAFGGPNNTLKGNINLEFGTNLPNPSGVNGAALLVGSGFGPGGSGHPGQAWIITDQAYDNFTPGNTLGITAGETQGAGVANGGQLLGYGGGSFGGTGGLAQWQGGTSANAGGGQGILAGGNATGTTGAAIPGDAFVIAGQVGKQGANVHLVATLLNGIAGDVRIRINSTILMQFLQNGEIYLTKSGTGAGLAGQPLVSGGIGAAANWLSTGFTGSVALAKLTAGGTNGSLTVASGYITAYTAPT